MVAGTLATHDLIFAVRLPIYSCKLLWIQTLIALFICTYNNHTENVISVICYCGNKHSKQC